MKQEGFTFLEQLLTNQDFKAANKHQRMISGQDLFFVPCIMYNLTTT